MMIKGWGEKGQLKLKSAKIVIAGVGGLGCPSALYLTAAGVGEIKLIDNEKVELSNLNRQILHWESDIGKFKVDSAREKLKKINSEVNVTIEKSSITEENAIELIKGFNLVIDALDNFEARFYLNKACVEKGVPLIHGAIEGFEGRFTTIIPKTSACLACIYGKIPFYKGKFPVVGVTPAVIAALQSMEALKLIIGIGELTTNRLLIFDGLKMEFDEVKIKRDSECKVCGGY
ncbi:HesA/MoeB/ThiF family protein [Candidatus Bathyarchaeota archaeon]|nr:HesA/MoeB/ThiF family protein [Candidatus Bathyarchaeota archaeon]